MKQVFLRSRKGRSKGYYARWYDRHRSQPQKEVSLRTKDRAEAERRFLRAESLRASGDWCPWRDGSRGLVRKVEPVEPIPMEPVTTEQWRPVVGFEGLYDVSNHGRVRNARTGQIRSLSLNDSGYQKCGLSKEGRHKTMKVHRMVAAAFVEGSGDGLTVNHINGCKTDNRAANLEWVSHSVNMKKAHRSGLFPRSKWAA